MIADASAHHDEPLAFGKSPLASAMTSAMTAAPRCRTLSRRRPQASTARCGGRLQRSDQAGTGEDDFLPDRAGADGVACADADAGADRAPCAAGSAVPAERRCAAACRGERSAADRRRFRRAHRGYQSCYAAAASRAAGAFQTRRCRRHAAPVSQTRHGHCRASRAGQTRRVVAESHQVGAESKRRSSRTGLRSPRLERIEFAPFLPSRFTRVADG